MIRVTLHDKTFRMSIPEERILAVVEQMARRINADMQSVHRPLFLCVLNGSFMFAADLLKRIDFLCEISFIKLASYAGTSSGGSVKEIIGLAAGLEGRTVIVIEDIVDTGNTLVALVDMLQRQKPAALKVATLLFKPEAYAKDVRVDYVGLSVPNDFIVGYGLDYNELGRNLRDIYTLES